MLITRRNVQITAHFEFLFIDDDVNVLLDWSLFPSLDIQFLSTSDYLSCQSLVIEHDVHFNFLVPELCLSSETD